MSAVKERMTEVMLEQPEDSSYEEILRELAFEQMIEQGLKDSRKGKVISNEEMSSRINAWLKNIFDYIAEKNSLAAQLSLPSYVFHG